MSNITTSTQNAIDILKPIADKIGAGTQYVYELYVKQAYITGVTELLIWVPVGVLLIIAGYRETKKGRNAYKKNDNLDSPILEIILGVVLITVGLSVTISVAANGIQHLINPGYVAIQDLITQVTARN